MKNKLTHLLVTLFVAGSVLLPVSAFSGIKETKPVKVSKSVKPDKSKRSVAVTENKLPSADKQAVFSKRLGSSFSDINSKLLKSLREKGEDRHFTPEEKILLKKFSASENVAKKSGKPAFKGAGSAFYEDFETTELGSIPSGWTIENISDPAVGFTVGSESGAVDADNITQYLVADDDAAGEDGLMHTIATSPKIDVTSAALNVYLSYYHDYEHFAAVPSYGKVTLIADNVPHELVTYTEDTGWNTEVLDITEFALGADTIQIQFEYFDGEDWVWGWAIDDIKITLDATDLIPPVVEFEPLDFVTVDKYPKSLTVSISDESSITSASVRWTTEYYDSEEPTWVTTEMGQLTGGVYQGEVGPSDGLEIDGVVVYEVFAEDAEGNSTTSDMYQYFLVPLNEIVYTEYFNDENAVSFFDYEGWDFVADEGVNASGALQTSLYYISSSETFVDSALLSSGYFTGLLPDMEVGFEVAVTDYETGESHILGTDSIFVWAKINDYLQVPLGTVTSEDFTVESGFQKVTFSLNGLIPKAKTSDVADYFRIFFEVKGDTTALLEGADFLITLDNFYVAAPGSDVTPPVIEVEPVVFTTAKTTPTQVSATITDAGTGIETASLFYGFAEDGEFVEVSFEPTGDSTFTGVIPGQEGGTDVYYYVTAMDSSGNESKSELYSYSVEELYVTPYLESFDEDGLAASLWIYEGDHYLGLVGTNDSYGVGSNLWAESPNFQLVTTHFAPSDSLMFSFQYRILEYADDGNIFGPEIVPGPVYDLQPGDSIGIYALVNDSEWIHLGSVNETNHVSSDGFVRLTFDLSEFSSDTLQIHFMGTHGGGDGDFLFIADNYTLGKESDLAVPEISVDTESISLMLPTDKIEKSAFTISNVGFAQLNYSVSASSVSNEKRSTEPKRKIKNQVIRVAKAADVSWLTLSPVSGSLEPEESQETEATINTTGLEPGFYSAVIEIISNDEANSLVSIPVSVVVHSGNSLYGFNFLNGAFAYTAETGGYVFGTNGYGDTGKYVKLNAGEKTVLIQEVLLGFGPINGSYDYDVVIRSVDEATGGPGNLIHSQTFNLEDAIPAATEPDVETGEYPVESIMQTEHELNKLVEVSGEFFVGIEYEEAAADAEAFSLVHNFETEPMNLVWERWEDGSFWALGDPENWGSEWLPWISVNLDGDLPPDSSDVTLHFPAIDSVGVGSLIQVPVYTTTLNGLDVFSMDCSITYDPSVLTYSKVIVAGTLSSGMTTAVNFSTPGVLTVSAAQATAIVGSDSVLIIFEFRGKAIGTSQISFTKAIFNDGIPSVNAFPGTVKVVLSTSVAEREMPSVFKLYGNYPNPFNPTTKLSFGIPQSGLVSVVVYNAIGQEVAVLANGKKMTAGNQELEFDASRLGSGVYFYQIRFGAQVKTGKMVLTK
ncbi:MAG: T9SS type A sorting domain-containing protein [Bacteroidetes bacterium]|nr:T9SS type A sorting domain-containing protein [Bacteroidota bacterium]